MEHTSDERTAATERRRFFADLVSSGRFCRDTRAGGLLHRGEVSLREVSDGDSLHVCVDGERVSVHVDHYSPVAGSNPDGTCRYSIGAIVAHVVAHLSDQVRRLAHGQRGGHRCRLECELVDADDDATAVKDAACHDPRDREPAGAGANVTASG